MLFHFRQRRTFRRTKTYKCILAACALLSWIKVGFLFLNDYTAEKNSGNPENFPRKIWQIFHYHQGHKQDFVDGQAQWALANPGYQYECLNEDTEDIFVRQAFRYEEGIRKTYDIIKRDPVARADLLRYLVLLAEGGVYVDADIRPIQPIDDWIPPIYVDQANLVLGIELDKGLGPLWEGMPWTVQISQSTIMARPNHPLIRRVVKEVEVEVAAFIRERDPMQATPQIVFDDLIRPTGPQTFTKAVFEHLSEMIGLSMTGDEISGLDSPFLISDVLIMPINAFGSGQEHSQSGTADDRKALVSHRGNGS